jgi:tetratricopeptide (TPR) repeat protein
MDPSSSGAYYGLGFIAEQRRNLEQARNYYDAGLRANAVDHNCWYAKGNVLRELGDISGAVQCYRQAIESAPSFELAWANAGACLSQLGYDDEALQYLVKATQLNSEDYIAWWNRASIEDQLGMLVAATKSYRIIQHLARSSNPQMAQYAIDWLARNSISEPP